MNEALRIALDRLIETHGFQAVAAAIRSRSASRRAKASTPRQPSLPRKRSPKVEHILRESELIRRIMSLYEAKLFLPTLNDVKGFLVAHRVKSSTKDRNAAFARVANALTGLSTEDLKHIERSIVSQPGATAFELLANELMSSDTRRT